MSELRFAWTHYSPNCDNNCDCYERALTHAEQRADEAACELLCRTGLPDEHPYHHDDCPIAKGLRDCWGTPLDLTERLPLVDLDPCSNTCSTVQAKRNICIDMADERAEIISASGRVLREYVRGDGLAESWKRKSVFINGPFSDLLPWARKCHEAKAFMFLANNATTTKWYRELLYAGGIYKFEFAKRLKFTPPPRIKPSTNNRDQVLICNREGWEMIGTALNDLGRWWVDYVGYLSQPRQ